MGQPGVTPRIVSLLPSATEIACALGFADALVGRSHECDFPDDVSDLPICTAPKLDPQGSGEEIHRAVSALVAEGLSVYRVDRELLRELDPTHVLTQVHCEVCAVSLGDVEASLAEWSGVRPRVVALAASSLSDVFADFERVAEALGVPGRGRTLEGRMRARMSAIAAAAQALPERPRVATIEWLSPPMAAGNWMPEIVGMAGAVNLFGEAGRHSSWISWSDVAAADPDALLVFPCGFSLSRVRREAEALRGDAGFRDLRAAREGRVFLCEGQQYFNRPGPRLVETLEIAAEALHSGTLAFGHEGIGWERMRPVS
ncbi:MAG TPA: ABC transporter substrate-binding protein [Thermoanaerobaculia bacterium]|nr:ABC transporter substrate-binding protein [Thermoanaerobaculia bacterium]